LPQVQIIFEPEPGFPEVIVEVVDLLEEDAAGYHFKKLFLQTMI
jgi:hypothetical protein